MQRVDAPSCHSGVSPTKNPDVTAGHGPATWFNPGWNRLVSGVGAPVARELSFATAPFYPIDNI
jgi:hypothetical protein